MKQRKTVIIVITFTLLISGYLTMKFLISQKEMPERKQAAPTERYVKAKKVHYRTIHASVKSTGRLISTSEVVIVAEASGKILPGDVSLRTGQSFRKGDVLLRIYKDETELELKAEKSRFLNAVANILPDMKVDYPDAYETFSSFFQSIDIQKDFPPMPQADDGNVKVFLASRNILADYYSIKKNELKLKRHTIYAPFNGAYMEVTMETGSYVNTGGRIGKIIHTGLLELEVPVENRYSQWIKNGDPVKVFAKDTVKHWRGTVVRKADYIDPSTQSRTIYVKITPDNRYKLFAGEYLTAEFQGGKIKNAMMMPRNAVFNHNEVFVVVAGKLQKRKIEIHKLDETTLIFSGLEEGTNLIVEPLINARENSPVEILQDTE